MNGAKHVVDVGAALAAMASVLHALPEILAAGASFLSIIWYTVRLVEWAREKKDADRIR